MYDFAHAAAQSQLGIGRIVHAQAGGADGIRDVCAESRTRRTRVRDFARAADMVRAEPAPLLRAGVAAGGVGIAGRADFERVGGLVKRHVVHLLQKYLLNPPIMLLFAMGVVRPGYALLETIGRKTGRARRTPVGDGRVGRQFWIVAEHGRNSAYVRNIEANPRVRIKARDGLRGRWYAGTAHILADDDPRERQRWLATQVRGAGRNAAAVRFFGTELLTVRIDLDE